MTTESKAQQELSGELPVEWKALEHYNLDYLRLEITARCFCEDGLYWVEAHYETDESFDKWWEGDLKRFTFLTSTFPASKVIFKEVWKRFEDDEPFPVGYRFLITHKEHRKGELE